HAATLGVWGRSSGACRAHMRGHACAGPVDPRRHGNIDEVPHSDEHDVKELNLTIDLCLRVGEMLLANGAGAADVTSTMRAVAQHLGLRRTDLDVTFTQIAMSYQCDPSEPTLVMIRQVSHRTIDYEDLTQVDHLVRALIADEL